MNVIKRSGEEVEFNAEKIENAIIKANEATDQAKRVTSEKVHADSTDIQRCRDNDVLFGLMFYGML